jgi:hypothetical protein
LYFKTHFVPMGWQFEAGKKFSAKKTRKPNIVFFGGPRFFHYRPNFSTLLNFAGPILKLFVWAVKRRPKTSPTYKIETLTLCSAHIFLTRHAPATPAPPSHTSRQAGRPTPASRTASAQHLQAAK